MLLASQIHSVSPGTSIYKSTLPLTGILAKRRISTCSIFIEYLLRAIRSPYCQSGVKGLGILVEREQIITVIEHLHVALVILPAGLLSLGTVDTLGQIILCCECCSALCRLFGNIPDLYLPDASSTPPSPDIAKCPLGNKIACLRTTAYMIAFIHLT